VSNVVEFAINRTEKPAGRNDEASVCAIKLLEQSWRGSPECMERAR